MIWLLFFSIIGLIIAGSFLYLIIDRIMESEEKKAKEKGE